MTPGQYLAAAKDALIIIGVLLLGWWIYHTGANANKVQDMSAVAKQIAQNETTQAQWRQRAEDASKQMASEMAALRARIESQRAPVRVCVRKTDPGSLPGAATAPDSGVTSAGGTNSGVGEDTQSADIRPNINGFEEKYEGALAQCRAIISQWPR